MMSISDDERLSRPAAIVIGEDLSAHSLEELADRRAALQAEIERIDELAESKSASRAAADSFFKT
ncbi:DUF1192 domain-containing protein [Amorphus orientalis]|uniref:Uncharacterized small protein (DUF1192 family) n=1 Tax=Amorphus orientalis TaxID=649198 RepID=A0AAE4ART7_9HYPH|nr:DUF1192 domain-containing protein [Amorphus orientalis]MDQ0314220.1 uncharacterized small protein (DUF1192 family) [Amorphus orientalis]